MERTVMRRRVRLTAAAFVAMMAGAAMATPAQAQRISLLIPNFEPKVEGIRGNFGRDAAEQARRQLGTMATHSIVERRDLQDRLRDYNLREQDLNCILAQQLATRAGYDLVLCGSFEPAPGGGFIVEAEVIAPAVQDKFVMEPFTVGHVREVGDHVLAQFTRFTEAARQGAFCVEELGMEQWGKALEHCNNALEFNPTSQGGQYGRAFALMNLERHEEALASFRALLQLNPAHEDAMLAAGIIATRMGQSDVAMGFFRQYLELNPGNIEVRMTVASDVFNAGDPETALRIMEEGVNSPDAPMTQVEYAGHFALATAQKKAAQPGPANGRAAEIRALYERSNTYFERVYREKGAETEIETLRNMLAVYNELDKLDEAVAFAERVTQSHPDDAALWLTLAQIREKMGDIPQAVAALDRAERIDPELPQLALRRAVWQLQAGNLADAIPAYRRAVQRGEIGANEAVQNVAGTAYQRLADRGQHAQAIQLYEGLRPMADTPRARAILDFFHGFSLLKIAEAEQAPNTCASARATLPKFQQSKQLLQGAGAFTEQERTRQNLLPAIDQFIDVQNALIRRDCR
jgi:tetratricopeptide (TPR) repeat protein